MFILPNLFTASSIFCGFYAAVLAASAERDAASGDLYRACIAVLFAMVFDSVDGRVARLTRTQSEFGIQMDSLADVVSFGVAPALIAWHWGLSTFGTVGLLACFVYCACGAIRLARFNVMTAANEGPSAFFVGLPIPAAAGLLVATIIASLQSGNLHPSGHEIWAPTTLVGLGLLMVSSVKFRTFKATRLTKRTFALIMLAFGATAVMAIEVRPSFAIVALMTAYLSLGLAEEILRVGLRLTTSSRHLTPGDQQEPMAPDSLALDGSDAGLVSAPLTPAPSEEEEEDEEEEEEEEDEEEEEEEELLD